MKNLQIHKILKSIEIIQPVNGIFSVKIIENAHFLNGYLTPMYSSAYFICTLPFLFVRFRPLNPLCDKMTIKTFPRLFSYVLFLV